MYLRVHVRTGKEANSGDAYHLFGHIYGDKSMSLAIVVVPRPTRICSARILLLLLLLGPVVLVRHRGGRTCTPNLATYVHRPTVQPPRPASSITRLLSARAYGYK